MTSTGGDETIATPYRNFIQNLDSYEDYVKNNSRETAALLAVIFRDNSMHPMDILRAMQRHPYLRLRVIDNEEGEFANCFILKEDLRVLDTQFYRKRYDYCHKSNELARNQFYSSIFRRYCYGADGVEKWDSSIDFNRLVNEDRLTRTSVQIDKTIASDFKTAEIDVKMGAVNIFRQAAIDMTKIDCEDDSELFVPGTQPLPG